MRIVKQIQKLIDKILRDQQLIFALIVGLILFVVSTGIYVSEQFAGSGFDSYFDTLWYAIVTLTTVGYGDISPSTTIGRALGMVLLIFGVGIFATISGKIASMLFDFRIKKEKGLIMLKQMRKHFIVCGWKFDFDLILEGIINSNPDITLEKIVLINTAPAEKMEKILSDARFSGITYVSGDFTEEATLLRAKIKTADRVLILSDYSQSFSPLEIDSRTVMGVLSVENANPKVYVAAELIDSKFEKHLSIAHCDEIILTAEYERNLVVSASNGTGLSHVLRDLLSKKPEEGLVISPIPTEYIGKTYADVVQFFAEREESSEKNPVPIGLLENTGNLNERRREALTEAQKNPNVETVIENMKRVKQLKSNHPVFAPPPDYIIKPYCKIIFVYNVAYVNVEKKQEEAHV